MHHLFNEWNQQISFLKQKVSLIFQLAQLDVVLRNKLYLELYVTFRSWINSMHGTEMDGDQSLIPTLLLLLFLHPQ